MFYPLVSVIIPVYQAEKFLTECVESVRKQDYSELEIVLAIRSLAARAEREQADIVIGTYRRWRANGEKVKCCSNLEKENPDMGRPPLSA